VSLQNDTVKSLDRRHGVILVLPCIYSRLSIKLIRTSWSIDYWNSLVLQIPQWRGTISKNY